MAPERRPGELEAAPHNVVDGTRDMYMEERQFHTAAFNMRVAFRRSVCIVRKGTWAAGKGRALY